MKIFGRRRRVPHSISTQTVPTYESANKTSEETISPFTSISDGQMQRNTDGGGFKKPLTQDKGVGVNFDNVGVLYTPAASVSTNVDPPPESPRDSMFEIGSSFLKDVGTSMTDLLPRDEMTSVSESMRNSLPLEMDKTISIYIPKKDETTSTSSLTERFLMPKYVDPFRRDNSVLPVKDAQTSITYPLNRSLFLGKDAATSFSFSRDSSIPSRKDAETSFSFSRDSSPTPRKDAETSMSFPREISVTPRKDAETSFSFSRDSSPTPRKDAETSISFPREISVTPRKDAETSFSFSRDSSPTPRKDAETSFSFSRDSSPPPRIDAETSFSFPRNSSMLYRDDPATSFSFSQNRWPPPRKDAQTSISFPPINSLTPIKDDATLLSPTVTQNDAYNSLQLSDREFFSPHQCLEEQGAMQKPVDAPGTFGQWSQVDPNELAARLSLMAWLAQPPATTSTPASNTFSTATQTESEVNIPEKPDVPDNGALCVIGQKINPPSKWAQRCRNGLIVPKSYPRQLKPKKKTSPYALPVISNSDRTRHTQQLRRGLPFEAIIPKDHVLLIQNRWGSRDPNCGCQVIIRPADTDSNRITVFSTRPNDKPPSSVSTTYRSDYNGFKGNS